MFYKLSILILLYGCVLSSSVPPSHDWDILIFTQHWPTTVCLEWKEVPEHNCLIPPLKNTWNVHGIWPTKLGTIGPAYCNASWHFNPSELDPIEDKLKQYWANIHPGNLYDLWHHEWDKHGTCAVAIPDLASEMAYFGRGLAWIEKYGMNRILESSGILPDTSGLGAEDLYNAVRKVLGKDPDIQCLINHKTHDVYLFEIRICFTKALELTDCDGIKTNFNNASILTNCPHGQVIIYPAKLPPSTTWTQEPKESALKLPRLLDALYFIQWLQWLTL